MLPRAKNFGSRAVASQSAVHGATYAATTMDNAPDARTPSCMSDPKSVVFAPQVRSADQAVLDQGEQVMLDMSWSDNADGCIDNARAIWRCIVVGAASDAPKMMTNLQTCISNLAPSLQIASSSKLVGTTEVGPKFCHVLDAGIGTVIAFTILPAFCTSDSLMTWLHWTAS